MNIYGALRFQIDQDKGDVLLTSAAMWSGRPGRPVSLVFRSGGRILLFAGGCTPLPDDWLKSAQGDTFSKPRTSMARSRGDADRQHDLPVGR
jgi:hypothetical protein